jgi:hypothetical protein
MNDGVEVNNAKGVVKSSFIEIQRNLAHISTDITAVRNRDESYAVLTELERQEINYLSDSIYQQQRRITHIRESFERRNPK